MMVGSDGADLKGNTLRVYTYLFKVQRSGVRETQRSLGFKSLFFTSFSCGGHLIDISEGAKPSIYRVFNYS